jgi:predicted DNA-binding protein with PD1-like motif
MRFVDEQGLSRHLVRSKPGEDLLAALADLAKSQRWKRALVIGAGILELVEVRDHQGELHTLEHAQLVALSGTVTSEGDEAAVMLLGTMISGSHLVTGGLVEAVAGDLLLRIDGIVEATPAALSDPPPAAPPLHGTDTEPPVALRPTDLTPPDAPPVAPDSEPDTIDEEVVVSEPSPPPPTPSPAPDAAPARVAVSDTPPLSAPKPPSKTFRTRPIPRRVPSRPRADDWDGDYVAPEEGEYLQHPQLGLCRVEGPDERGGTIIVVPSGRRRTLRLDALRVMPAEEDEEGRQVYKILGPRR